MKKIITIGMCLTLVLIQLLAVNCNNAYAATENVQGADVTGSRVESKQTLYRVDVTWGKMQFIYKTVGTRTWNDKTHLFDEDFTSTWSASGNTVQVTNHSNTDVKAKFSYSRNSLYNGVIGKFNTSQDLELPSAEGRSVDDRELTGTRKLTLSGKLVNQLDNYTTVGKIKIEID